MKKEKHYVIGDVHGEYAMLLALVEKLPNNAKLIFVGDLVHRGSQSREVIAFVKERAFAVVQGNHEEYFIKHGKNFLKELEQGKEVNLANMWMCVGGLNILESYGLITLFEDKTFEIIKDKEGITSFREDLAWIEQLPLYLELGLMENYPLPVVITHGSIGDFWHLKESTPEHFESYVLSNRIQPSLESPIFNIYGHTYVETVVRGKNFVSLDTGCGKDYGAKLSAYCIESGEVFEVSKEN